MATKNTITRAEVLTAVVKGDFDTLMRADAREVAGKMLASITRKSDTPKKPSKAAQENERLAHEVAMAMPENEVVLTSWIMEHVSGIMTPQKCVKVMQVLIDKGRVEKVLKVQGRYTGYKLVQWKTQSYPQPRLGGAFFC